MSTNLESNMSNAIFVIKRDGEKQEVSFENEELAIAQIEAAGKLAAEGQSGRSLAKQYQAVVAKYPREGKGIEPLCSDVGLEDPGTVFRNKKENVIENSKIN